MEPWFGQGGGYEQRYFKTRYTFSPAKTMGGVFAQQLDSLAMNYGIPGGTLRLFPC